MKGVVVSFGLLLALSALTGCSSSQRIKPQSARDTFSGSNDARTHTVAGRDVLEVMRDELAHAIGTTTLTSSLAPADSAAPDSRVSLEEAPSPALQTWGTGAQGSPDLDERSARSE